MHTSNMVNGCCSATSNAVASQPQNAAADFIPLASNDFKAPKAPTAGHHNHHMRTKRKRETSRGGGSGVPRSWRSVVSGAPESHHHQQALEHHQHGIGDKKTLFSTVAAAGTPKVTPVVSVAEIIKPRTEKSKHGASAATSIQNGHAADYHDSPTTPTPPPPPPLPLNSHSVPGAPWIPDGRNYSQGIIGLHEEIEDFFQWMVPTVPEHHLRVGVINRIRSAVMDLWPQARVDVFGSFRTGLYLPTSDIDIVIIGNWPELPLRTLERVLLERNIADPGTLKVLEKAAVPIVKMTDKFSHIKVDISFNMTSGVRAAELVKHFRKRYPALSKLTYVLKQFLQQRDLNELHPRKDAAMPNVNLGVLLIEFFERYGRNFNYLKSAIRVTEGGALVPKDEMQSKMKEGHQAALLSIEDPLDPGNDVGRSSYGALLVKQTFEKAYVDLTGLVKPNSPKPVNGTSILRQIISVSDDIVAYRGWISSIAPSFDNPQLLSQCFSEDCHPPNRLAATSSSEVEPRELPPHHFKQSTNDENDENKNAKNLENNNVDRSENGNQHSTVDGFADNNGDTDNLSTISIETSAGVSVEAQSFRTASDTDSDVMTPSFSPSSAMSISPANSDVLGSLKYRNQQNGDSKSHGKKCNICNSRITSKNNKKLWHKNDADLDTDWRAKSNDRKFVSSIKHGISSSCSSSAGSTVSSSSSCSMSQMKRKTASEHRADEDPNWRNHEEPKPPAPPKNRTGPPVVSIKETCYSNKPKVTTAKTQPRPLSDVNKIEVTNGHYDRTERSNKERLTDGLKIVGSHQQGNGKMSVVSANTTKTPEKTCNDADNNAANTNNSSNKSQSKSKKSKKRKKGNNGGNSNSNSNKNMNENNAQNNVRVVVKDKPSDRFSSQSGLSRPNR